jgi:hypothetical protein
VKRVRILELARTGEWGRDGSAITRRDLAEAAETFAGRPPLTVGHVPRDQKEGPRYGQVLSVSLADNGNTLLGQVEFGDAANDAYEAGMFDRWSVSIPRRGKDGKRYLHHLALLGETPPKIPGLRELGAGGGLPVADYHYADGDTIETYSFEGAMKEREEGMDPAKELAELKERLAKLEAENKKLLEEKAERERAEAAAKAAAEAAAHKPAEGAAAEGGETGAGKQGEGGDAFSDRLNRMEEELRKSRVEAFMAKAGGRLPEGLRDKARGLARELAGNDEGFNFSDNGKAVNVKAVDLLAEILAQWPAPVKTGGGGFEYSDADGGGRGADWGKVARGM